MERRIPENLSYLDQFEQTLRAQSVASIESDEVLLDHVELIEAVMNHLNYFSKRDFKDINEETIQLLGARVFNDLASAYGQLTRGYYQMAAATLRDVMEIVYLWGWFDRDPAKIAEWRNSESKVREEIFKPWKVRKFLDAYDGFKEGKRGAAYKMFCEYAAHATPQGFVLMRPSGGGQTIMGPFFDSGLLKAVLEETAQLAAQVGNYFAGFFDGKSNLDALGVTLHRYDVTGRWAEKYLGRPHDRDFVAQMRTEQAAMQKRAGGAEGTSSTVRLGAASRRL